MASATKTKALWTGAGGGYGAMIQPPIDECISSDLKVGLTPYGISGCGGVKVGVVGLGGR